MLSRGMKHLGNGVYGVRDRKVGGSVMWGRGAPCQGRGEDARGVLEGVGL